MDFAIAHTFDAPADEVAAAVLDLDFQASLGDVGALKSRTVLSQHAQPSGEVVRRVRCVPDVNISGAARKFLGDAEPAWVEEATWHPSDRRWDWLIHPEVGEDILSARGSIVFEAADGKTGRTVAGFVKISIPLYGRTVEGWIVKGLERAYDEEAERLAAWLARRPSTSG